jgi:flagellar biosynthesis GTPase FlhF
MDDVAFTGSNHPPGDLLTGDSLREKLTDLNLALISRRDELLAAADRVPDIADEDTAAKVSDFIKQLMALHKASEAARVGAKEPYLEGGRGVDGFFRAITDPVAAVKTKIERKLTTYLRDKADRERREREEQARLAREEEARRRAEADAAAQKMRDEQSLAAAVEAEKQAKVAEADTTKAEKEAAAKPAELSRTRGEYGAVSSLRTSWTFRDLDRAMLDLEMLRHHIPADGLDKAVRSFIRAGGRTLVGVTIYETTDAVVR